MAALCLPVLGGTVAMLFVLTAVAPLLPPRSAPAAMLGLCLLAILACAVELASPSRVQLSLPWGFGLLPARLALDPLGAVFGLAVAVPAAAGAMARLGQSAVTPGPVAALLLLVLAGDPGTFILALAAFAVLERQSAAMAACVILVATGLALMGGLHTDFAAMRLAPPTGIAALAGAGLLAAGAMPMILLGGTLLGPVAAIYVLLRLLFELAGPATPLWWGAPLLLAGAGLAVITGLQALHAADMPGIVTGVARQQGGWMLAALGAALIARGADLPPLAGFAISALLLTVLAAMLAAETLTIATGAVERGAGTLRLDALGGLARSMPVTALALLGAACSLGLLPLTAGFAGAWMVFQALFAGARIGGWPLQLCFGATVALLALAGALAAASLVRLAGVAFLGRPRTPRAAAAEESAPAPRYAMALLSVCAVVVGLLPGAMLALVSPVVLTDMPSALSPIAVQRGIPGYAPALLAAVVVVIAAIVVLVSRRASSADQMPAWEDGFAAPPAWLPFGDPATQASPAVLSLGIPALRLPVLPSRRWPALPVVQPQWVMVALALAAVLAALV